MENSIPTPQHAFKGLRTWTRDLVVADRADRHALRPAAVDPTVSNQPIVRNPGDLVRIRRGRLPPRARSGRGWARRRRSARTLRLASDAQALRGPVRRIRERNNEFVAFVPLDAPSTVLPGPDEAIAAGHRR